MATLALAGGLLATPAAARASAGAADRASAGAADRLDIVVTTTVLGALVRDLVGDGADVRVLMDGGMDPHDWAPSARDIEAVHAADLVVENGLGLEVGLQAALDDARREGIPVFAAADAVHLLGAGGEDADGHASEASPPPDEADHDHAAWDPHIWTDPLAMRAVVDRLAPVLGDLGLDVAGRQVDLDARLDALDREVRTLMDTLPADRRRLVTGHDSMGYFARAYGLELVGSVIPGRSSLGEISARQLAALAARIRQTGVRVVFTEMGTPRSVAEVLAEETGVRLVPLPSHALPEDGSYETFIRVIAATIAEALAA